MQSIIDFFSSLLNTRLRIIAETSVTEQEQKKIKANAAKSKRKFFYFVSFCAVTTAISIFAD